MEREVAHDKDAFEKVWEALAEWEDESSNSEEDRRDVSRYSEFEYCIDCLESSLFYSHRVRRAREGGRHIGGVNSDRPIDLWRKRMEI